MRIKRQNKRLATGLITALVIGAAGCAGADETDDTSELETHSYNLSRPLGCKRDPSSLVTAKRLTSLPQVGTLPSSVDLSSQLPPVGDQQTQGSCVGHAVGYAAKTMAEKVETKWSTSPQTHQFSPSWVYNQINNGADNGAYIADAMNLIINKGADTLSNFPYVASDVTTKPSPGSMKRASRFKAASYNTLTVNTTTFKTILASGQPIVIGVEVFPDFDNLNTTTNTIYNDSTGTSRGRHALTIVGYDNARSAFRFVNSWGTSWGQAGFGWLSYSFITDSKLQLDAYVLNDAPNKWTNILYDYDGDGLDDNVVWRAGTWYIRQSRSGTDRTVQAATAGDGLTPADFDGDGTTDVAYWTPSNGVWTIIPSGGGSNLSIQFGAAGDITVPGDYDGDGKADVAVFRAGTWFYKPSKGGADVVRAFGASTDMTVPADYDGDGKTDFAYYRPSTGDWHILRTTTGTELVTQFGVSTDRVVPGDYDGDGKADVAVFRPGEGNWYYRKSSTGTDSVVWFGTSTDRQLRVDFDGDGKTDPTVFRPEEGNWYSRMSGGAQDRVTWFGEFDDYIPYEIKGALVFP